MVFRKTEVGLRQTSIVQSIWRNAIVTEMKEANLFLGVFTDDISDSDSTDL